MRGQEQIGMVGRIYDRLIVKSYDICASTEKGRDCYLCLCACKNTIVTQGRILRDGTIKSCGCLHKERRLKINLGFKEWAGMVGRICGQLIVKSYDAHASAEKGYDCYLCQCDCGILVSKQGHYLRSGRTLVCSQKCDSEMQNTLKQSKVIGRQFDRLTPIEYDIAESNHRHRPCYLCKCTCRNTIVVQSRLLRDGTTKSCGCIKKEQTIKMNLGFKGKNHPSYIHGQCDTVVILRFYDEIREYHNFQCQICNKSQNEELREFDWKLTVHHKNRVHDDNRICNVQTLCAKCHHTLHTVEWHEILKSKRDQQDLDIMHAVAEQEQSEQEQSERTNRRD